MTFDATITAGALLNASVIFIGFVVAFTKIGGRIDLLSQRLAAVEETLKFNRDISERTAIIETRQTTQGQMIALIQTDIQDMKRGRGFIAPRADGGVNGEWS